MLTLNRPKNKSLHKLAGILLALWAAFALFMMYREHFYSFALEGEMPRWKMIGLYSVFALAPLVLHLLPLRFAKAGGTLWRGLYMAAGIVCGTAFCRKLAVDTFSMGNLRFLPFALLICAAFFGILWLILWDVRLVVPIGFAVCALAGYLYRSVVLFRQFPVCISDFASLGTAAEVAGQYAFSLPSCVFLAGDLLLLLTVTAFRMPPKKHTERLTRLKALFITAALALTAAIVFFPIPEMMGAVNEYWGSRKTVAAANQGIGVTLLTELHDMRKTASVKPDAETLQRLSDEMDQAAEAYPDTGRRPNVIIILSESLCDYRSLGLKGMNGDVLKFTRSLRKNAVWGDAYVSAFGGSTCVSEHNLITSTMPTAAGVQRPYTTISTPTPSVAWELRSLGYKTVFVHPEKGRNYRREEVIPLLGFEDTYFIDSFDPSCEQVLGHISDRECFGKVISLLEEEEEPLCCFALTMQNHSPYSGEVSGEVAALGRGLSDEMLRYLSGVKESDRALQELVEYLNNCGEDTIILIVGDHQPKLDAEIHTDDGSGETRALLGEYITPYTIWANFPMEAEHVPSASLHQLVPMMLEKAGLPLSGYDAFVLENAKEYPVINCVGFGSADGSFSERTGELTGSLADLDLLRANRLYGTGDRLPQTAVGLDEEQ